MLFITSRSVLIYCTIKPTGVPKKAHEVRAEWTNDFRDPRSANLGSQNDK